ncbi:MAG: hypothetical protein LBQ50_10540 [Planctomycetaceae bacterium]|jgi:hypothetical protein|nr:hypothetical protein [Planctomycetaceae bacterium]
MDNNPQMLTERIRAAISFPDTISPEEMRHLARQYKESCTELNRRMWQCMEHIRNSGGDSGGNLAEAVRLAEMKPNLQELYTSLDFEEREEWCELVSTFGFDVPPPLPNKYLEELNEVYLKISPMEPLLRWHRFYALNGSSVRERLAVLRAIAKADITNTFWSSDQEDFEKVRIKELGKEIQDAIAAKNSVQIRALYNELTSPDWRIKLPEEFRRTICAHVLQGHADTLLQHFAAFDYSQAVTVHKQIQQILDANKMALPADIERTIRPAVRWLNETEQQNELQYKFERCSNQLQKALEQESPVPTLESLYYSLSTAASQAGATISAELEKFYRSQIHAHESRKFRKTLFTVITIVSVCLLVGGVITLGLVQRNKQLQINKVVASLQNIETEKRFGEIPGAVQRYENESAPEIRNVLGRLKAMLQADQERAKKFEDYYSKAATALEPPKQPTLLELEGIKIFVDDAGKLFRIPQEETKFLELKRKFDTTRAARQRETDTEFSKKLEEIQDEFKTLPRNAELSNDLLLELNNTIKDLISRTEKLLQQYGISKEMKKEGDNHLDLMVKYQKETDEKIEQNQALQKLFDSVPNWTAYESELKNFVVKYSKHQAASDMEVVLQELEKIKEVYVLLHGLADSYNKHVGDFDVLKKEAPGLLKQYENLSSYVTVSPEQLFSPGKWLEKLSQTKPLTTDDFKETESHFKNLSKRQLWAWIDKEQWYYLTTEPKQEGTYDYVTTFISDPKPYRVRKDDFKNNQFDGTQYKFAIEALKKIDSIREDGSKEDAVDVICALMKNLLLTRGIDPILKCVTLNLLISDLSKIDPIFADNFKRHHEIIKTSGIDMYINWMDVNSTDTIPKRNQATVALGRLPAIETLALKTKEEQKQLRNALQNCNPRFEWIGALSKSKGAWSCQTKSSSRSGKGDLYILRLKPDKTVAYIRIGSLSGTEIKLDGIGTSCLQGIPVFLKQ